jgi:hypothetical protein
MTTFAMPAPNPVLKLLLTATASSPAALELTADSLEVRLGLTWRARIPRSSITSAGLDPLRTLSVGAHGWGGRWLVNTTTQNLVVINVHPEGRGHCVGWPVRVRELHVSVADPDVFLAALGVPAA